MTERPWVRFVLYVVGLFIMVTWEILERVRKL